MLTRQPSGKLIISMNKQKGFTVIEGLIILLVIALLAVAGWYGWQKRQENARLAAISNFEQCKADKDSKVQESYPEVCVTKDGKSFTNPNQKVEAKPQDNQVEDQAKYLEIKEWGVKMKLSDATDDAYYVMQNGYAYLSLTSLKNVDSCAAEKTSLGALARENKDAINELTGKPYADQGVTIGKYTYVETQSQAGCTENVKYEQAALDARIAFAKDAKTITEL